MVFNFRSLLGTVLHLYHFSQIPFSTTLPPFIGLSNNPASYFIEKFEATQLEFFQIFLPLGTSLVAQPTMRETQVQSLGWEDLLEKKMATHFSILAWKIP